jgi:outer membrane receptor protein involved in Fe transport
MFATRSARTGRSVTFISALLLSSALAAPAFAQIEEVVVTAQKKSEDIQSVPIAVSAFTSQDLAAHQIQGFKDLQFSVPNVTFTHGNFGPSNFQIRGIGSAAVATSGDAGVSVNEDDVYLSSPPLTSGSYYDTERVEVLRGPQSTLYGRNATGGAINVITAKPDVDNFHADLEGTYGNYNFEELRGMVNIPIIEGQLGLRVSGFWENRDGTIKNIYPALNPGSGINDKVDSRSDYSVRGALRWTPTDRTMIDLMLQTGHEDDSRIRAQATRCHTDPSGVLGCLPDSLAAEAANANAGLSRTFASEIGPLAGSPFQLYNITGATADPTITNPVAQQIPNSLRKINEDFNPYSHGRDLFAKFNWKQTITPWLDANLLLGYDNQGGNSQQAYTTNPGSNFADFAPSAIQAGTCFFAGLTGCTSRVAAAEQIFGLVAPINYANYFAGHIGTLPLSATNNNGTVGNSIARYVDHDSSYDQISGQNKEWTSELRFSSNFNGPFNFLIAGYHLDYRDYNVFYFVNNSGAFDYPGIILGPLLAADGTVLGPTQFNSDSKNYHLKSNAIFGEVYYNITDDLKLTGGLRYTTDDKHFESKSIALIQPQPIGTTTSPPTGVPPAAVVATCAAPGAVCDANGYLLQNHTYDAWTGHGVVTWTPKTDWSDQTMVYASYSRGYRSGGFNPPASVAGLFPSAFAPETVDAYEVGTKNTFETGMGALQANVTGWYYDYKGYQVSQIVNRQSVNGNINSTLYGAEGEFFWAPTDDLQFSANVGYTHSAIGNTAQLDTRSPTLGTHGWTLLKDSIGANCALQTPGGGAAATPLTSPIPGLIVAPQAQPGASVAEYAGYLNSNAGVPFGLPAGAVTCGTLQAVLDAVGAGAGGAGYVAGGGVLDNLKGNQMPNTPNWTLSLGVQYTFHLDGDYTLVPRFDYYWNGKAYGTIYNDPADRMKAYDVMNAQIQLNAPDNLWYARAWVQNLADSTNVTGMYVTDPSSALFTNLFVGDPRTYGLTVGVHF